MEVNKNTTQAMNPVLVRWRAETQGQIEKKKKKEKIKTVNNRA